MKKQTLILIILLVALVLTGVIIRLCVRGDSGTAMSGGEATATPAYKHCGQVDWT